MWHSTDGMGWWMILGSVWMVFFWAVIIYVVFALVSKGTSSQSSGTRETHMDILKRRYASGEISKEEYDRMRNELS